MSWALCRCSCCLDFASACISSCTEDTADTGQGASRIGHRGTGGRPAPIATDQPNREIVNARKRSRLRTLAPGRDQLRDLYFVRLQLLQAALGPRLALLRRVQRLSRGVVHGDVRLSADDLPPFGLAAEPLSEGRLAVARRRAPPRDAVRLGGEPAFWTVSPPELRLHRRWVHFDLGRVEGALRSAASAFFSHQRSLRPCAPPTVCRLRSRPVWIPAAVADSADAGDVPDPRH